MLIDKLKQWEYYYKKLPLYMRNSYGIKEHFQIIWNVMMQLEDVQALTLDAFNLLQDNYVNNIIAKYDDVNGYDFKFLDTIGSIYGVNRSLNVSFHNDKNEEVNKTVQNIQEETGVELLTIHNLSNITEEERSAKQDYISIMNENIEQLKNELYD